MRHEIKLCFLLLLFFFKIGLHISTSKKWVLTYIPGTSPCNMPGVFSHYNYTLSLQFIKTGRSCGLTSAVHTKCGCWVYVSNIVGLRIPSHSKNGSILGFPLQFATWVVCERLRTNNPGNCLTSGRNFLPYDPCLSTAPLVAKWVAVAMWFISQIML